MNDAELALQRLADCPRAIGFVRHPEPRDMAKLAIATIDIAPVTHININGQWFRRIDQVPIGVEKPTDLDRAFTSRDT